MVEESQAFQCKSRTGQVEPVIGVKIKNKNGRTSDVKKNLINAL